MKPSFTEKKNLLNVTLIAYDNTDHPEGTLEVMRHCRRFFNFGESVLVCRPHFMPAEVKSVQVDERGYEAALSFEFKIGDFVHTDFSLFVSSDGYIVNPEKWDDDWLLKYDFIGAPWPPEVTRDPRYRVGNTGFCLRSRKFMDVCNLVAASYRSDVPADVYACQVMRPLFEKECDILYAPISVAADFSWEMTIQEFPLGRPDAFGFHKNHFMRTHMTRKGNSNA